MDDVTGKPAEAEWQFAAKEEKSANEQQHSSNDQKRATEISQVHVKSLAAEYGARKGPLRRRPYKCEDRRRQIA